jgi:hypothetical protein
MSPELEVRMHEDGWKGDASRVRRGVMR